jgi:hypothetical protein
MTWTRLSARTRMTARNRHASPACPPGNACQEYRFNLLPQSDRLFKITTMTGG